MASYQILKAGITETIRLDQDTRTSVPVKVIRYRVGAHGPFTYQIDAADFTPEKVDQDLEAAAQGILKLLGS